VKKHKLFDFDVILTGYFRVAFCLCFKTSLRANHSYESVFCLQVHFYANQFNSEMAFCRHETGVFRGLSRETSGVERDLPRVARSRLNHL